MLKQLVMASMLLFGSLTPAFAQQCLHGPDETAVERERREYVIRIARQINELEAAWIEANPRGGQYARPSQLKLPEMPDDFELIFHMADRRYIFSLKDARDPCYFAVFSDNGGLIYATMPQAETRAAK